MLCLILPVHQLIIYDTLSQGSSKGSDHASTTAQQGSTGTRTPPQGKSPRTVETREEKGDRMRHDLLGIGSHFENKK